MVEVDLVKRVPVGAKFRSMGRTISEGEFALLTNVTWTLGPLHSDKEVMAKTPFGERVLAGGITLALMGGLASISGITKTLEEEHGIGIVAMLTYEDVRFRNPLFPGDTIEIDTEITEVIPTSKPNRAILKQRDICTKQNNKVVCEATRVYLIQPLEAQPPGGWVLPR